MKNIIAYYYDFHPSEILKIDDLYTFDYNNDNYIFEPFERPLADANALYNICKNMIKKNIMVNEIILNNQNSVITYIKNKEYVLIRKCFSNIIKASLKDICYFNNKTIGLDCDKLLYRYDWIDLWENKNDYFEMQINEIEKRFPNLCGYANYYIGLCENAIMFVKYALKSQDDAYLCISHKRIHNEESLISLYNPVNFIYDFRVRDAAEYIKNEFFNNNDAFCLVQEYFSNNYLTYKEALLFYGRLLYPSYFFDKYDDIVNNNLQEYLIEDIILKCTEYEMFLKNVYLYISNIYNSYIPEIEWIIKRSY